MDDPGKSGSHNRDSELSHLVDSTGTYHKKVEEIHKSVNNMQKHFTEVPVGESSSWNAEKPRYAEKSDAMPSCESDLETQIIEVVEEAKGTGTIEDGLLETQVQVCDQLGLEGGAAPDDGLKSPGLQQIGATQLVENQLGSGKRGRGRPRKGTNTQGSPIEVLEQRQAKGTGTVADGLLETQVQVCAHSGLEGAGAAPVDGSKSSGLQQIGATQLVESQLGSGKRGRGRPRKGTNTQGSSIEVLEQRQAKGTGTIADGLLETQMQVGDQLGLEGEEAAPDDGSKSPGLQQIGATQLVESQLGSGKRGRGRPRKGTNAQESLIKVLVQRQAKGTGTVADGLLGTQVQVCAQSGLEGVGAAPVDGSKSPGLQQIGATQLVECQLGSGKRGRGRPRKGTNTQGSPIEVLVQRQAKGTGSIADGLLETQVQVCDRLGFEGAGVAPDGGSESPGLQQIGATQLVESQLGSGKRGRGRPRKGTNTQGSPTLRLNSPEIRRHLRYFLSRISYEQNLIHAYVGEGWKGQSLEKIRPVKELERAKSEILRRKVKIRDLFQRIDVSCAEGRLPESLFDDQGEIDCEDIFCAKCGSKDVNLDNDIILCDGNCQRGFHQFCLEPPLLKEDVPPGDEGWLCPACDCKIECIDLLNKSQGTNLSITDDWEKVFPEAAAVGNSLDDMGLPSEDSDDDDYKPDGPELNEEVEGDESSSDDSDFSSASEDLGAVTNNEQFLGLPSDDSEDDDYNPDKLVLDEQVTKESSGSDFTSDSEEEVNVLLKDAEASNEVHDHKAFDKIMGNGKPMENGVNRPTLNDEQSTLLESETHAVPPVRGKRRLERLDYKRLHDEEYGRGVSSDSSDEDYNNTVSAPKKRKNSGRTTCVPSPSESPAGGTGKKQKCKQRDCTPKKESVKESDVEEVTSSFQAKSDIGSNSNDRAKTTRLGEAVTQKLYESFKMNQYPGRGDKENLAKELSLTFKQVDKWFENARWSFNHGSKGTQVDKTVSKIEAVEAMSRKRKLEADHQETDAIPSAEKKPMDNLTNDSLNS